MTGISVGAFLCLPFLWFGAFTLQWITVTPHQLSQFKVQDHVTGVAEWFKSQYLVVYKINIQNSDFHQESNLSVLVENWLHFRTVRLFFFDLTVTRIYLKSLAMQEKISNKIVFDQWRVFLTYYLIVCIESTMFRPMCSSAFFRWKVHVRLLIVSFHRQKRESWKKQPISSCPPSA